VLRTTLKNLSARKLRLFTTSLAVVLGVAFMAGTLVLTDTIGQSFDQLFADANAGTDAFVRDEADVSSSDGGDQRSRLPEATVAEVAEVDGVAAAEASIFGYAQLVGPDGETVGSTDGMGTFAGNWNQVDELNPMQLVDGREPADVAEGQPYEVVLDKGSANDSGLAPGDTASVLTEEGNVPVTVVGVASFAGEDSPGGSSYLSFTMSAAQALVAEPGMVDGVAAVAEPGVSQEELAQRISTTLALDGSEVLTGDELTEEQQSDIQAGLSFFNTFLLTFAVIALFVGSFIIYNTFSILVAQRTKEMALMRALGASRRQVLGSVLTESVVVGLIASIAGVVLGVGVAAGLQALIESFGVDLPAGEMVIANSTVIASLVAGLGVCVASAVFPAYRASKVAPLAAMRDVAVEDHGIRPVRVVVGLVITALGGGAIAAGVGGGGFALVALGALLVFVGISVLGPVLARPFSRVVGAPLPLLRGLPGRLARENAMRNPKRTATTASALMVGVAMVVGITVLATSAKASVSDQIDEVFYGELVIESGSFGLGGLSPQLAEELNQLPEVDAASGVRVAFTEVDGSEQELLAIQGDTVEQMFDVGVSEGAIADLGPTQIGVLREVAEEDGLEMGDTVDVRFAETGVQPLTVAAIYDEAQPAGPYLIGMEAYDANVSDAFDAEVYVDLGDGVSLEQGRQAVEQVTAGYPNAEVQDTEQFKAAQSAEIDSVLNMIYVLLALAVFIALMGIANTLALSIFERTREMGLLRAVGMSRRQLRTSIRWESVLVALLGTTTGLAVGLFFGWALVQAMSDDGIELTIPTGQLLVITALAALAGVLAAVLPARRAARMDVLEAVSAD
jgi:putative ABC transport system permease protein